jgi:hypothetical protein
MIRWRTRLFPGGEVGRARRAWDVPVISSPNIFKNEENMVENEFASPSLPISLTAWPNGPMLHGEEARHQVSLRLGRRAKEFDQVAKPGFGMILDRLPFFIPHRLVGLYFGSSSVNSCCVRPPYATALRYTLEAPSWCATAIIPIAAGYGKRNSPRLAKHWPMAPS